MPRNVDRAPCEPIMQISVTHGLEKHGHSDSQDRGRSPHDSPHGFYRALILAHGQRVTWLPKWAFTREYGHAVSLLIMVCF
jgi:hypothetical protein